MFLFFLTLFFSLPPLLAHCTEDNHPADTGGDQLRLLLPAVVHRLRHHATDPVSASVLCDLFKNAILFRHLDGDGNIHSRPAAAVPAGKYRCVILVSQQRGGGVWFSRLLLFGTGVCYLLRGWNHAINV